MKILLVEDDDAKADLIEAVVIDELGASEVEIVRAATVNDSFVKLGDRFDLVIVDLVLPQFANAEPADATQQWCEVIENHLAGKTSSWIVMTSFPEVAKDARDSFARHGVAVIHFDGSDNWEKLLSAKLRENNVTRPLDFVIVCALEKEREGYGHTDCVAGEHENVAGLDCQRVEIGAYRGVIVVQPGPGMISAAIVTTKALSIFRPRAVAMSGICGGREGETELGALIVPEVSWNYQSGKFVDGKLTPDLVQVWIPPFVKPTLTRLLKKDRIKKLREGLLNSELADAPAEMPPMVSGSQVVADADVGDEIGEQGRKVAAIDMEVASVLFAARDFYNGGGVYFAAKTVVDLANPHKDDRYHEYGCALSARFVTTALAELLTES